MIRQQHFTFFYDFFILLAHAGNLIKAIAGLVPDEELNENNILPEAFDPRVADVVSRAVKELI